MGETGWSKRGSNGGIHRDDSIRRGYTRLPRGSIAVATRQRRPVRVDLRLSFSLRIGTPRSRTRLLSVRQTEFRKLL